MQHTVSCTRPFVPCRVVCSRVRSSLCFFRQDEDEPEEDDQTQNTFEQQRVTPLVTSEDADTECALWSVLLRQTLFPSRAEKRCISH